jgi:hypothetical protein
VSRSSRALVFRGPGLPLELGELLSVRTLQLNFRPEARGDL